MISKYEKATRPITLDALDKLADLFRCSIDYFINENESDTILINVALRGSKITGNDLKTIARINRIIFNLKEMEQLKNAHEIRL